MMKEFLKDESGQGIVEYAILLGALGLASIPAAAYMLKAANYSMGEVQDTVSESVRVCSFKAPDTGMNIIKIVTN